jgi:hypothetical protein
MNTILNNVQPDSMEMLRFFEGFFNSYADGQRDERDIEFNGDGSYFGKQISIIENSSFGIHSVEHDIAIEVAYSATHIVIYTDYHSGFWVNPYLDINEDHSHFPDLKKALMRMLTRYFGV